ncbi:hypothetical protein GCM10009347_38510 [Shewanella algicola]|uniref:Uncharacterized protein n=1 Tax=Shewanella algicola TaxID=640633 RepID=A0A9X2CAR6_9GAMM|nr:hypothetical protein [Shewanella algicola]MCL1106450.1 hypothetical protein [Shewanella algicola]GGP69586.1 hypothetical protein GCM10009347_38510 [Shewanella algicola]
MMDKRLENMQAMAKRFSENGSVDQLTMRKIDALAMSAKKEDMTAARIQLLRK